MKRHAQLPKAVSLLARCAAMAALVAACIGGGAFTASAGSLTPPGPPGPTIQQKPTWDKTITVAQRFVDALNTNASGAYEAVLDKETGLVWAKEPNSVPRNWDAADYYCKNLNLGGRMGWRLPTVAELTSLFDWSNPGVHKLPVGQNMFQNVPTAQYTNYWSSSIFSTTTDSFWQVGLNGYANFAPMVVNGYVWPVRGGQ